LYPQTIEREVNEKSIKKESKTESEEFYFTWYWYEVLYEMGMQDITRMNEMAGLNLYVALNFLQYKIQKTQLQNYLNRTQNK
jgi:hypothetical protein